MITAAPIHHLQNYLTFYFEYLPRIKTAPEDEVLAARTPENDEEEGGREA